MAQQHREEIELRDTELRGIKVSYEREQRVLKEKISSTSGIANMQRDALRGKSLSVTLLLIMFACAS